VISPLLKARFGGYSAVVVAEMAVHPGNTGFKMSKPITGEKIQQIVADLAKHLPDATCTQPFGPEYDVFKVKEKVFAMTTEVPGKKIVTLKCDPERSIILREVHDTVTPGYHMNKRHWISIAAGPGVTQEFVSELVTDAYRLVVATLPKRDRPE
jgi:predicted DNA-binding protein (MmcQ/YjbR family)